MQAVGRSGRKVTVSGGVGSEGAMRARGADGGAAVASAPKFGKNGIHLGAALLKSYGFKEGKTFKFSAPEAGKILLEKI